MPAAFPSPRHARADQHFAHVCAAAADVGQRAAELVLVVPLDVEPLTRNDFGELLFCELGEVALWGQSGEGDE